MMYRDEAGCVYEGRTASEVVESMMRSKLSTPRSRSRYRAWVARRVEDLADLQIDFRSDKVFLASLVEVGLLERLSAAREGTALAHQLLEEG